MTTPSNDPKHDDTTRPCTYCDDTGLVDVDTTDRRGLHRTVVEVCDCPAGTRELARAEDQMWARAEAQLDARDDAGVW